MNNFRHNNELYDKSQQIIKNTLQNTLSQLTDISQRTAKLEN